MLCRTAFSAQSALRWCSVARARMYAAASFSIFWDSMSGAAGAPPLALGLAAGLAAGLVAGLLPPRLTGWADPMLVPGAITAMSAASVMYRPAEAGRAPDGAANNTTGTGAPRVFLMV